MQVSDTPPQKCCRCEQDVTNGLKYTARHPLPAGADKTVKLYDCCECAHRLLVTELSTCKEKVRKFQEQLKESQAAHQQTQAELNKKATELDNAQMQCEAYRLSFRTHGNKLPMKDKAAFDTLVAKQLESIKNQFATKQAVWCEKQAAEAEKIAAEHAKKASSWRAQAETVRANANKDQQTLAGQPAPKKSKSSKHPVRN